MLRSLWRNGNGAGGFITKIPGAGFSGIVDIIWGDGVGMMRDKFVDGVRFVGMLLKSERIVAKGIFPADLGSVKRCSTGHTIHARFNLKTKERPKAFF